MDGSRIHALEISEPAARPGGAPPAAALGRAAAAIGACAGACALVASAGAPWRGGEAASTALAAVSARENVDGVVPGGVYDENGCVPTAGFSWCNHTQRCFRPWEEACVPVSNSSVSNGSGAANHSLLGGVYDENGCVPTAGYSWCKYTQRCFRPWEEACAPVSNSSVSNSSGAANHSLLGGVYDENGCVPTAGYSWCNHTQRCFRPWEEACVPVNNSSASNGSEAANHSLLGGVYDENGCVPTAGYSWCNHTQRCFRPWEEACVPVNNSSASNGSGAANHSLLGGVYDENGCVPTAGYSWCNHTQRCFRPWEEACAPENNSSASNGSGAANHSLLGGVYDENGCVPTAGYSWCNYTQRCHRPWEEACLPRSNTSARNSSSTTTTTTTYYHSSGTTTTTTSQTTAMTKPGGLRDENGCIPSAGYSWCNHTQRCHRPWEEACTEGSSGGADRCDHSADPRRCSPSGLRYPAHWGAAPGGTASLALASLPGAYGAGSYELRGWILAHQHADAARRPALRGSME